MHFHQTRATVGVSNQAATAYRTAGFPQTRQHQQYAASGGPPPASMSSGQSQRQGQFSTNPQGSSSIRTLSDPMTHRGLGALSAQPNPALQRGNQQGIQRTAATCRQSSPTLMPHPSGNDSPANSMSSKVSNTMRPGGADFAAGVPRQLERGVNGSHSQPAPHRGGAPERSSPLSNGGAPERSSPLSNGASGRGNLPATSNNGFADRGHSAVEGNRYGTSPRFGQSQSNGLQQPSRNSPVHGNGVSGGLSSSSSTSATATAEPEAEKVMPPSANRCDRSRSQVARGPPTNARANLRQRSPTALSPDTRSPAARSPTADARAPKSGRVPSQVRIVDSSNGGEQNLQDDNTIENSGWLVAEELFILVTSIIDPEPLVQGNGQYRDAYGTETLVVQEDQRADADRKLTAEELQLFNDFGSPGESHEEIVRWVLDFMARGSFIMTNLMCAVMYMKRLVNDQVIKVHAYNWRLLFMISLCVSDKIGEDRPLKPSDFLRVYNEAYTDYVQRRQTRADDQRSRNLARQITKREFCEIEEVFVGRLLKWNFRLVTAGPGEPEKDLSDAFGDHLTDLSLEKQRKREHNVCSKFEEQVKASQWYRQVIQPILTQKAQAEKVKAQMSTGVQLGGVRHATSRGPVTGAIPSAIREGQSPRRATDSLQTSGPAVAAAVRDTRSPLRTQGTYGNPMLQSNGSFAPQLQEAALAQKARAAQPQPYTEDSSVPRGREGRILPPGVRPSAGPSFKPPQTRATICGAAPTDHMKPALSNPNGSQGPALQSSLSQRNMTSRTATGVPDGRASATVASVAGRGEAANRVQSTGLLNGAGQRGQPNGLQEGAMTSRPRCSTSAAPSTLGSRPLSSTISSTSSMMHNRGLGGNYNMPSAATPPQARMQSMLSGQPFGPGGRQAATSSNPSTARSLTTRGR